MGALDLKAKVLQIPKGVEDKGLKLLYKNLDKKMEDWPAAQKALENAAMHVANAFFSIEGRANSLADDKKTPPEQVAALKELAKASRDCAKHFAGFL